MQICKIRRHVWECRRRWCWVRHFRQVLLYRKSQLEVWMHVQFHLLCSFRNQNKCRGHSETLNNGRDKSNNCNAMVIMWRNCSVTLTGKEINNIKCAIPRSCTWGNCLVAALETSSYKHTMLDSDNSQSERLRWHQAEQLRSPGHRFPINQTSGFGKPMRWVFIQRPLVLLFPGRSHPTRLVTVSILGAYISLQKLCSLVLMILK